MGWFWNNAGTSDNAPNSSDPLNPSSTSTSTDKPSSPPPPPSSSQKSKDAFSHLKPELRAFLEREAPIKPTPPSQASSTTPQDANPEEKTFKPTDYSKYGDRYADIWAQYKPLEATEREAKTPQMAITDVYNSYRDRRKAVGKAAMENCAEEQYALHDCYAGGAGWTGKMTGCSKYHKVLDKCFMNQQEFLKTLGYMADMARSADQEERIQMHADKLYREQCRREEEAEARARSGQKVEESKS